MVIGQQQFVWNYGFYREKFWRYWWKTQKCIPFIHTKCRKWKQKLLWVGWNNFINKSLSKHPNNNFKPCPVPELLDILTLYRERIAAIVYTQREGTPNILSALYSTKILILNVSKALLSPRKRLDRRFRRDLWRLHPTVALESSLVLKVLRKAPNLRALLKNRSKTKRPSKRQRQALRKQALAPTKWIDCSLLYFSLCI